MRCNLEMKLIGFGKERVEYLREEMRRREEWEEVIESWMLGVDRGLISRWLCCLGFRLVIEVYFDFDFFFVLL